MPELKDHESSSDMTQEESAVLNVIVGIKPLEVIVETAGEGRSVLIFEYPFQKFKVVEKEADVEDEREARDKTRKGSASEEKDKKSYPKRYQLDLSAIDKAIEEAEKEGTISLLDLKKHLRL